VLFHQILACATRKQPETIARIQRLVECESPSDQPAMVDRFSEMLASEMAAFAKVRFYRGGSYGRHLSAEMQLPGRAPKGRVLVLGHGDTVWPAGTLSSMPFRRAHGRLWGPGVLDMKGGIAIFLAAVECLRELDVPVRHRFTLQVNSDEEVGSHSSRTLTEKQAARSLAVLVLEPGTGLSGKLKTARKGVGDYRVTVHGKPSHAGVDFEAGASAVLELARQISKIAEFTNLPRGITVNPGVVAGGTRSNVIAAEASVHVDIRVARLRDAAPLDRKLRGLKPVDRRCRLEVSGGLNRPPMERTPAITRLFAIAKVHAQKCGIALEDSMTGGGSDGNFTAALAVPTLDGLGVVGEGAHAANESILVDRIADRTALLAMLLASELDVRE
jgi:glutamate carboxypeptidase